MFRTLTKGVAYTASGISCFYCMGHFVCGIGKCEDVSMMPAIQHGDLVLITPFHVRQNRLMKGDVVFCHSPKFSRSVICKRIIGMEGDSITDTESGDMHLVSQGHVWLEGDNKEASYDSRDFGSVPYGLLLSRVSLRIWPLNRLGFIPMIGENS